MKGTIKYIFIIGILLSVFSNNLYSQKSKFPPELYIGVRGGWVASTIYKAEVTLKDDSYLLEGFSGGIAFRSFLQKHVGLQLELNYITKGGYSFYSTISENKFEEDEGVDSVFTLNLNYIELPFMMQLRVGKKNKLKINFGSHIGYLISKKHTFRSTDVVGEYDIGIYNKLDFGLNVGAGYARKIGKFVMDLDFRYSRGFVNLFKYRSINNSLTNQNHAMIVSLSLYFKL